MWIVFYLCCTSMTVAASDTYDTTHDDVIKWQHFPRYWPFVPGIYRSPVNSPHRGHWLGALMFSLIAPWINGWVNNREAGDLRRHHTNYDVNVMYLFEQTPYNLPEGVRYEVLWTAVEKCESFSIFVAAVSDISIPKFYGIWLRKCQEVSLVNLNDFV